MKSFGWPAKIASALLLFVATATASFAQTFDVLVSFDVTNGSRPYTATLVQGIDGNYYGTTQEGGNTTCGYPGCGTIFKITADGSLSTIYAFCASDFPCPDGYAPLSGLVEDANGNFYGTTWQGGVYSYGTLFKLTPTGALTTLHAFCSTGYPCPDGSYPESTLVLGANGNLYGVTAGGGTESGPSGLGGTVFEITPAGKLTTLYDFCSQANCADGGEPTGLVQGADGNFYGTTYNGGNAGQYGQGNGCVLPGVGPFYYGCGTVFKITPQGKLTTLYTFCLQANCPDGAFPEYGGGPVQAANGNFYGITNQGGANVVCAVYGYPDESCGTVFEITPGGKLTTLHSFCSENPPTCEDGFLPFGTLSLGSDGNLYGTTPGNQGGNGELNPYSYGTIFEITPSGTFTTLHAFCNENPPDCTDGDGPLGPPPQGTNGIFYGTTIQGGTTFNGTVYSLSTGLGPFVETVPTVSDEGAKVSILGQGFSSSSTVKFGGTLATSVTLNGSNNLIATVPAGALTGTVTVTTGSTTLQSNQKFLVLPKVLSFSPTSGPVGTPVTITGTGFLQGLGAGFGDKVPATNFKVVSDTEVTADVPSGAKTGPVGIETKGGIGISKQVFSVTQ